MATQFGEALKAELTVQDVKAVSTALSILQGIRQRRKTTKTTKARKVSTATVAAAVVAAGGGAGAGAVADAGADAEVDADADANAEANHGDGHASMSKEAAAGGGGGEVGNGGGNQKWTLEKEVELLSKVWRGKTGKGWGNRTTDGCRFSFSRSLGCNVPPVVDAFPPPLSLPRPL